MKLFLPIVICLNLNLCCSAQKGTVNEIMYLGIDVTDKDHFEVFLSNYSADIDVLGKYIQKRAEGEELYRAEVQVFLITDKGQSKLLTLTHREITTRETERQRRQIVAGFLIRVKREIEALLASLDLVDLPATRIYEPISHIIKNHPAGVPGIFVIWSDLLENHKGLSLYNKVGNMDIKADEIRIKKDCYCSIDSLGDFRFYFVSFRIEDNDRGVSQSQSWWFELIRAKGGVAQAGPSIGAIFRHESVVH